MPRVLVIGAGHNGLVAATFLARGGLSVTVCEAAGVPGGAVRTTAPFPRAPRLRTSPGAYLLGVMPPELIDRLGARFQLLRRDPHYFVPTLDRRSLLIGSDRVDLRRQCLEHFSLEDWHALEALDTEIGLLRDDLAPTWLREPMSADETADRFIRPALRERFLLLVRRPVEEYLAHFGFRHDLFLAMLAITDGFSGLSATVGQEGTGFNFLVHNMCRLPNSGGTWMIVQGGMGSITAELMRLATTAGAAIRTDARVTSIRIRDGRTVGVSLESGEDLDAEVVVSNADPFTMQRLAGQASFPAEFNDTIERWRRTGTTMKVNLALDRLPPFTCLPEDRGQYRTTIHLLPQPPDVLGGVRLAFETARRGELPEWPAIEWYTHTVVDPSLQDDAGRHSAAFFVQWVPYTLAGHRSWDAERAGYADHLVTLADRFAPGLAANVADRSVLAPPDIEREFGMPWGHIHHVDNTVAFDRRMPYRTPVPGLYSCSAGCHPAGSVIGAAGHNAAERVLADLG